MKRFSIDADDRAFLDRFESCRLQPSSFDHGAHLRLAYCCLAEDDVEVAHRRVRTLLSHFLDFHGVDLSKYHETMTRAWLLAVDHFMRRDAVRYASSRDFVARNPRLLDSDIMLTHYSSDRLFSEPARLAFLEPDRQPIPRHPR
ncbi:MAG: hypothetical protein AAGN46_05005 [Acidobacteriota bacterium]